MKIAIPFRFLLTLGVILVTLKLVGLLTFSWWFITAPLWAPYMLIGIIVGLSMMLGSYISFFRNIFRRE